MPDADTITRSATLKREPPDPNHPGVTIGRLTLDDGWTCYTCELPWLDNAPDVSCIPPGQYQALWTWSPEHGCNNYRLQAVAGRSAVEIHPANVPQELEGCVALGLGIVVFRKDSIRPAMPPVDQMGVASSVEAVAEMEKRFRDTDGAQLPFWITIS